MAIIIFSKFSTQNIYYKVMDSVLKNIVVCLLVVVPFPWTMQISLESQFVYHTSEKRYRLIIPIFQDILSVYAIVMIEKRNLSNTYSKCKTLCWEFVTSVNVCITLLCNISNKFFKTFSYNGNYYMQFYSVTQWLMYNDIASWVCNILFIMFNLCYYYT